MAPGLTIGLVRPCGSRSTAAAELKASPVALTPTRRRTSSRPTVSHTSAKTKGLEMLIRGKGTEASPEVTTSPPTDATARPNRAGSAADRAG